MQTYLNYIRSLPINDTPEIFGLHENANITFAQNETFLMLGCLVELQPKTVSGGGKSREEVRRQNSELFLLLLFSCVSCWVAYEKRNMKKKKKKKKKEKKKGKKKEERFRHSIVLGF